MNQFDLTGKDVIASVDPTIAIGSRVKLVRETGDKDLHSITVTPER